VEPTLESALNMPPMSGSAESEKTLPDPGLMPPET
jgi:hypothetical protein